MGQLELEEIVGGGLSLLVKKASAVNLTHLLPSFHPPQGVPYCTIPPICCVSRCIILQQLESSLCVKKGDSKGNGLWIYF